MGVFNIFQKQSIGTTPKTAEQRKSETQRFLRLFDIPYTDHLPILEEESEAKIRTAQEIAERVLILTYLNYFSEAPDEKEEIIKFLQANSLWNKVSPDEKEIFLKEDLAEQDHINISWRSEAIWLLLWTINKVSQLKFPSEQVEIREIIKRIPEFSCNPGEFIEKATIRPTTEILDTLDLTYRLHWAVRNADLNKIPSPKNLNLSIITERHYAINWVTYYAKEWDKITTDT